MKHNPCLFAAAAAVLASGCTQVRLEYDRMTGTALPAETEFDGETVNFTTIYLQGNVVVAVQEGETGIPPLTGPADPTDPNQYDYITPAELDGLIATYRASPMGPVSWDCSFWVFDLTCTRYHAYGIVVAHYDEEDDGTRNTGTLGWMYDAEDRSGFVNYYKNAIVSTNNEKYLRSAAHELGHAFNLNHCDGDGATTIENQTRTVGDAYTYEFSAAGLEHLQDHPRETVWPGSDPRHYACPHVH